LIFLALATTSCHSYPKLRTPECDAIVNRCMESCANGTETLSPRSNTLENGSQIVMPSDPCEQRCANKC
jgi:hypothetical protein